MNPGKLKHTVKLLRPGAIVTDDRGNRILHWHHFITVRAAVRDVSGYEFYRAQSLQEQDLVTFTLRFRENFDPDCRIVFHGRAYDVVHINHLGYTRDYMQVKARIVMGRNG